MVLESFIGLVTGAGGPAQGAARGLFLVHDVLERPLGQGVVPFAAGQGLGVRRAGGGLEDGQVGLGDGLTRLVHPSQGVIALGGAGIDQDPAGRAGVGDMGLGGVNHVGQGLDARRQVGIGVGGILPDLIGVGGQVHLGVGVIVEDAVALGVEITKSLVVAVVLKKALVGADHLGVLGQALADALAQADETLDPVGGDEGVAEDAVGALADAIDAAGALDEADDGPGQVVIDDDGAVLEVLTLGQDVGGDEHPQFIGPGHLTALVVGPGGEAPGQGGGVLALARGLFEGAHPPGLELGGEVARRIGELGEDEQLFPGMDLADEPVQLRQLGVSAWVPVATGGQDANQGAGVGEQVLGKLRDEKLAGQPFEAALEGTAEAGVDDLGLGAELGFGAQARGWRGGGGRFHGI